MRLRMASVLSTLLAVLCGAVASAGDVWGNASRVRRSPQPHHMPHRAQQEEEQELAAVWKRTYWKEMHTILRNEASHDVVECCPSVLEMVAPKGGRTPGGLFVELYEDENNKQQYYELSCAPGVADMPCRFVDSRLYNQSRCVQKYSYSYALVRNPSATEYPQHRHRREGPFSVPGSGGWSLDYVRVRAGCECQITPPKRKQPHRKRLERHKQKKKVRRQEEEGET